MLLPLPSFRRLAHYLFLRGIFDPFLLTNSFHSFLSCLLRLYSFRNQLFLGGKSCFFLVCPQLWRFEAPPWVCLFRFSNWSFQLFDHPIISTIWDAHLIFLSIKLANTCKIGTQADFCLRKPHPRYSLIFQLCSIRRSARRWSRKSNQYSLESLNCKFISFASIPPILLYLQPYWLLNYVYIPDQSICSIPEYLLPQLTVFHRFPIQSFWPRRICWQAISVADSAHLIPHQEILLHVVFQLTLIYSCLKAYPPYFQLEELHLHMNLIPDYSLRCRIAL